MPAYRIMQRDLIRSHDFNIPPTTQRWQFEIMSRRQLRLQRRRAKTQLQIFYEKVLKFLPIRGSDVFKPRTPPNPSDSTSSSPPPIDPVPSRYKISEIAWNLSRTSSEFSIRETDSDEYHEWIISDECCVRKSRKLNEEPYREKRIEGLPRNHRFQSGMLTKFYMENSDKKFDVLELRIQEDREIPNVLSDHDMIVKKLKLEFPETWLDLDDELYSFIRRIALAQLEEVHLVCTQPVFKLLMVSSKFQDAKVHVTIPSMNGVSLEVFVPKSLTVKCKVGPLSLAKFHQMAETYCGQLKTGTLFAAEVQKTSGEPMDLFETLDGFTRLEGWSFREFENKPVASKMIWENGEVLVYYCETRNMWIIENGSVRSTAPSSDIPLMEQVHAISTMTIEQRQTLRECLFWEPLIHYSYETILVNLNDPEVRVNGEKLPEIERQDDAKRALMELFKHPKSAVKKFKVIGTYDLFSQIPRIRVSELFIEYDGVHARDFFNPFKGVELDKLTVSSREVMNEVQDMITTCKTYVILQENDSRDFDDGYKEKEEIVLPVDDDLQLNSDPDPILDDEEVQPDYSKDHYESISLNFEDPEVKVDGKSLPRIDIQFDVYKEMSNLAAESITVTKMKITGHYPLFQMIPKFVVSELWLKSDQKYPESFFEPFQGVRLKKLTVSSRRIVDQANELVSLAKEFIVLEDGAAEEEEDDDEPPAKRTRLSCSSPQPYHSDGDDGEPSEKRRKLSPSPAPMCCPTPEPDYRAKTPDYSSFQNDFELQWAISESKKQPKREQEKPKEPLVHHLSKNFMPQAIFPIPMHGYPSTSGGSIDWYEPWNHYHLSRYEPVEISPALPRYPTRCPTPTETYVPDTPFDIRKYEDDFHRLCIRENASEEVTVASDQAGPSEL